MSANIHTHVDFRDKALKILGSVAKLAGVLQPTGTKDVQQLAGELSRVRKWLKFLKILRMYRNNVKNFPGASPTGKLEICGDFAQMVTEDLGTLHRSGAWTGLLKLPVIKDVAIWEDRAWFFWATAAFVNSLRALEVIAKDYFAASEADKEKKKPKLLGCLLNSLKFACEIGDSGIALLPADSKRGREGNFTVASALLGGTSAVCSIHKFLYPSYY